MRLKSQKNNRLVYFILSIFIYFLKIIIIFFSYAVRCFFYFENFYINFEKIFDENNFSGIFLNIKILFSNLRQISKLGKF
jgi:hypothetical protein